MSDDIPHGANRFLIRVARDLARPLTDPQGTAEAILCLLENRNVPDWIIWRLRPHIAPFVAAAISGRIDPFATQPWECHEMHVEPDQTDEARALIEQLISQTYLYATSDTVKELLVFVSRLRSFAPFNAMLLHIQKPGLTHAATARDWRDQFRRRPKRHARPLVVLRTKGPVDFVFDVLDTEGEALPASAFCFPVLGDLDAEKLERIVVHLMRKAISTERIDVGDRHAGSICSASPPAGSNYDRAYHVQLNGNHSPAQQFVTLMHELAHLFLGHLGADRQRRIPDRTGRPHELREVEAETVAYVVARRNGMTPRSESYLDTFKGSFAALNFHAVMRAANQIETVIGVPASIFQSDLRQ